MDSKPLTPARIADNVATVRQRMAAAAARSGRSADDVRLIAVTKYVGLAEVQALLNAGCFDLGESRPQELWQKAEALSSSSPSLHRSSHWHLIGHLQRNKVRRTLPLVSWFHSVDSLRLIEEIDREAALLGCQVKVLLEVNISGDESKHGFAASDLPPLLPRLASLPNVAVRGLMGMSALEGDADEARRNFADLRSLCERLRRAAPPNVAFEELSMGMSGDYEIAIEEGATMVRIGSALFEP